MAFELLFTSAPRGVRPGSSGYCTVSQTRGIPEDLSGALERRSRFVHEPGDLPPPFFGYRLIQSGGRSYRVLSRSVDAGLDFTGRRHFFAHHLALRPEEATQGRQPAEILLGWPGWQNHWSGTPSEKEEIRLEEILAATPRILLPASAWKKVAGDAGWAALPLHRSPPVAWYASRLGPEALLRLMAESLGLAAVEQPEKSWNIYLDVAGPSTPPGKEAIWIGRGPAAGPMNSFAARNFFRIEDCVGPAPEADAAEIQLARTGQVPLRATNAGRHRATADETARIPDAEFSGRGDLLGPPGRRSRRRKFVLLTILGGAMAGMGSVLLWKFAPPSRGALPMQEETGPMILEENPHPNPLPRPSPPPKPPGEKLRDEIWQEAGGQEPVERLHLNLNFGRPWSEKEIVDELRLALKNQSTPVFFQASGGLPVPATPEPGPALDEWGREASQLAGPWSLRVFSEGKPARGLAYLPDPFPGGLHQILEIQEQEPGQIFAGLVECFSLPEERWSIKVHFPERKGKRMEPIEIYPKDSPGVWKDRVRQQALNIRKERDEILQKAAFEVGEDPTGWDETQIRQIADDWRRRRPGPAGNAFLQVQEEYETEWAPWVEADSPQKFRQLLQNEKVRAELLLNRDLVVRRLKP